jgi:hypothetical protein
MEETNMSDVVEEIKTASEEDLREVIERWFESTRMDGMRLGAYMISAAVYDVIIKNIKTGSLRDHQRAIKAVLDIVSVQLKQKNTMQNDLTETTEESANDGTAE